MGLYFVGEYIKGLILHEYPALLGSRQQILCLVLNPVLSEIVEFSLKFRRQQMMIFGAFSFWTHFELYGVFLLTHFVGGMWKYQGQKF